MNYKIDMNDEDINVLLALLRDAMQDKKTNAAEISTLKVLYDYLSGIQRGNL